MDQQHNMHGYIQDDTNYEQNTNYEDIINNVGWQAPGEQQFSYAPPAQEQQYRYAPSQPSFDHFDISPQPPYQQVAYSNSPYASQYQLARPPDVFGATPYSVDPSLQVPAAYHGQESNFSYAPQAMEAPTISPQSLQYNISSSQNMNRGIPTSFQQSVDSVGNNFNQGSQNASPVYYSDAPNGSIQPSQISQVRYPTLPTVTESEPKPIIKKPVEVESVASVARAQPSRSPPQTSLRLMHPEIYSTKNSSLPRLDYAPFVTWEDTPIQVTLGLKNTLPKYLPRKSRSGRDLIPNFDVSQSLTPARISTKKAKPPKAPKAPKVLVSKYKGTSQGPRPVAPSKVNGLRDEGSLVAIKPPSTPTESSSSEDESSSEEESEYEEDEVPVIDISEVRGHTRPTGMAEAARWDAIGIIWKDPGSAPSADVVKDAIEKYGTFVTSLRTQIKGNAVKIEEAAARPADLEKLQGDRRVLLESLHQAIDAANMHGYGPIVENLGGHHKLVNGLTTTLIDCIKTDDFVGKLPKAIFSLLAKFQTMTDELLKKVRFDSLQKRWNKKGDDETKKLITTILANTVDAKEKAPKPKKDGAKGEDEKKVREKVEQPKPRLSESVSSAISSPSKRPHEGDGANSKPNKKFASDVAGTPTASSKPVPPKRPLSNLLGIASKPTPKPVKKPDPSPPAESKLGALLASIAKPPEPPKAPEKPARAPETPEEKARRERKESRRHLRVKFKEGEELEEIRLFKHEQAEDEGRQDEMLRDAHDFHREGMMHKKRVFEAVDDDDEYQPPDVEVPYSEPKSIDFGSVTKTSSHGPHFITRGGELAVNTPEQKTQARREGLELMVVYTDPNDIPPSPKEPPLSAGSGDMETESHFQPPTDPVVLQRLQEIQQYGLDSAFQIFLSRREERAFREIRGNRGNTQPLATTKPSADVSSILQQLGGPVQHLSSAQLQKRQITMDQNAWDSLLRIIDSLKGKPFPPVSPPDWMTNEAQRAEWWDGFNRDKASRERKQAEQIEAQIRAASFQQPPPMLPPQFQAQLPPAPMQFPPAQQAHLTNPQLSDVNQQVQNLLAGYQHGDSYTQPSQPFDYNSWAAQSAGAQTEVQGFPNQNQQPRWDENWNNENSNANPNSKSNKGRRSFEPKPVNEALFDERGEYKGKKKPCKFYKLGQCAKGTKCTFLHDD